MNDGVVFFSINSKISSPHPFEVHTKQILSAENSKLFQASAKTTVFEGRQIRLHSRAANEGHRLALCKCITLLHCCLHICGLPCKCAKWKNRKHFLKLTIYIFLAVSEPIAITETDI